MPTKPKKQLNIRLPEDMLLELQKVAEEMGVSFNCLVNLVLRRYLRGLKKELDDNGHSLM